MKFTLTFDGELPSSGNSSKPKDVWAIRKHFHPQMKELWLRSEVLKRLQNDAWVPIKGQFGWLETYHTEDPPALRPEEIADNNLVDLCEPMTVHGRRFLPIVRKSLATVCGLNILFLRKEEPGKLILQGGDIDNRMKTLFDALRMPSPDAPNEARNDDTGEDDPIYCALESDALITAVNIKTDRLLSRPNSGDKEVHLVIEVDVRVTHAKQYNLALMGD